MTQQSAGPPGRVEPVKLFAAVLYSDEPLLGQARKSLSEVFGPEDYAGAPVPFDHTGFYLEEMGGPLYRVFISYARLVHPQYLVAAKHEASRVELELAAPGPRRRVNIDPGVLDYLKLVLASFKYQPHKIYLDRGVWADLALYYRKGDWAGFEWTFPDFKTGRYDRPLLEIRSLYKRARQQENP
ncbi:MAG: DUF4416 family protein [Candidatus Glassbacteria bacterium]|nr:DUF4416 family protein [Candidatus Glassbacteria bacterium]